MMMMMIIMTNFKGYLSRQLDCGVISPNNDYLIKRATKNIFLFTRVLASKHTYGMHPEIALVGKKRDYERPKKREREREREKGRDVGVGRTRGNVCQSQI